MQEVMKCILSNRLIYPKIECFSNQSFHKSILKGISFDSSVCMSIDDLSLNEEYFCNLKKFRFKCTESVKQVITFSKMTAYSLENL